MFKTSNDWESSQINVGYQNYKARKQGLQSYHTEDTQSCRISEAKQGQVFLILGWEDTKKDQFNEQRTPIPGQIP